MEELLEQFYKPTFSLYAKEIILRSVSPYLDSVSEENTLAICIGQAHLKGIMECYKHPDANVRKLAAQLIEYIFQEALLDFDELHPCIIAMATDPDEEICAIGQNIIKSDYDIFPECLVVMSLKFTYEFHKILSNDSNQLLRGFTVHPQTAKIVAISTFLYDFFSSVEEERNTITTHTQFFKRCILNRISFAFETDLHYKLYLADNLAHLPYQTKEEIFYIVWHINVIIKQKGLLFLGQLRNSLGISEEQEAQFQQGINRLESNFLVDAFENLPENCEKIFADYITLHSILLLLDLKEFLLSLYGIKMSYSYNPFIKNPAFSVKLVRKHSEFNPKRTIKLLQQFPVLSDAPRDELKENIASDYLYVKRKLSSYNE